MGDKVEPLSVKDMNTISEAILTLVYGYPELPFKATPSSVQWQSICDNEGIGIYTLSGAAYTSKYVSGNYTAKIPFRIVYKCKPDSNKLRIGKQTLVENLAAWLEECKAEMLDSRIQIEELEQTSRVYKTEADASGYEAYTCTMNLKYFFKKG